MAAGWSSGGHIYDLTAIRLLYSIRLRAVADAGALEREALKGSGRRKSPSAIPGQSPGMGSGDEVPRS